MTAGHTGPDDVVTVAPNDTISEVVEQLGNVADTIEAQSPDYQP